MGSRLLSSSPTSSHRSGTFCRIRGGRPLEGEVTVAGAKNAALPIMAASLLCDGPVCLASIPRVTDVSNLARVLTSLGCVLKREEGGAAGDRLTIASVNAARTTADERAMRRIRAGFCVLGPLLAKRGAARVPLPGGCRIGPRPVDLHLRGLEQLGAEIRIQRGCVVARASRLRGAEISLRGPLGSTVTGTANLLCAAALARGRSVLRDAAREPEVVDLGHFLQSCGARIDGLGSATIEVRGAEWLRQVDDEYRVIPDRIEAATWLIAGTITGGEVTVSGASRKHLAAVLDLLTACGAEVDVDFGAIKLRAPQPLRAVDYVAEPYPGLPTDLQPLWGALLTQTSGRGVLRDQVFPERLGYLDELARLGARYARQPGGADVLGPARLTGATLTAADLRGGAALLLAALAARGMTTLRGLRHLDRGYDRLWEKLGQLGVELCGAEFAGADFDAESCGNPPGIVPLIPHASGPRNATHFQPRRLELHS